MDALGRPQSVLVLGGGSDIAAATMRRLVAGGTRRVVLAGRDPAALPAGSGLVAGDATVETLRFDARDTAAHEHVIAEAFAGGDIDVALLAFGVLGAGAETDPDLAVEVALVNYVGAVSAALHVARAFRRQGHGTLVVLSSIAGERVRRANFVYGSTKAGLDGFSQGLGDALHGSGVRVMIVRPGFVRTRMTAGMTDAPFTVGPDEVAEAIVGGLARDADMVWVPAVLRWVMAVLRHLPRSLFRRLPR